MKTKPTWESFCSGLGCLRVSLLQDIETNTLINGAFYAHDEYIESLEKKNKQYQHTNEVQAKLLYKKRITIAELEMSEENAQIYAKKMKDKNESLEKAVAILRESNRYYGDYNWEHKVFGKRAREAEKQVKEILSE